MKFLFCLLEKAKSFLLKVKYFDGKIIEKASDKFKKKKKVLLLMEDTGRN